MAKEKKKVAKNPSEKRSFFSKKKKEQEKLIDNHQSYEYPEERTKVLLLGAHDSGKSTLFKQFINIYGEGFSETQRQEYKKVIHEGTIKVMQELCRQVGDGPISFPELVDPSEMEMPVREYQDDGPEEVQQQEPTESVRDYTEVPDIIEELSKDQESALRPTTIKPGPLWTLKQHDPSFSLTSTADIDSERQGSEKSLAFDLMETLTRAGTLPFTHTQCHVVLAYTHPFAQSLMQTVCEENINPIEEVERSMLLVASVVHEQEPLNLLADLPTLFVG